ncbi:MAG: hypothetical protein NC200_05650 [Candidatus Gastranaerophilales bacterium]|nr:hypothetical protein [Candidatus Gastranaerophilales bacterium]
MIAPVNFASKKININSRKFYDEHPNLAPRNIYLYLDRTTDIKEVNKTIENIGEPAWKRTKNWFQNKIGKLFSRDKK